MAEGALSSLIKLHNLSNRCDFNIYNQLHQHSEITDDSYDKIFCSRWQAYRKQLARTIYDLWKTQAPFSKGKGASEHTHTHVSGIFHWPIKISEAFFPLQVVK